MERSILMLLPKGSNTPKSEQEARKSQVGKNRAIEFAKTLTSVGILAEQTGEGEISYLPCQKDQVEEVAKRAGLQLYVCHEPPKQKPI